MSYNSLTDALRLADRGFKVFPLYGIAEVGVCVCDRGPYCTAKGKHPRYPAWQRAATTDSERIEEWNWDNTNVGIYTDGLIVLDVDPRHNGIASLEMLTAQPEIEADWPETLHLRTGSGGEHFVWSGVTRGRNGWLEGIDIKSTGGYIVGPGSWHETGGWYSVIQDLEVAEAPRWIHHAEQHTLDSHSPDNPLDRDEVGEGGRDNHLTQFAGVLRRRGLRETHILAALRVENDEVCSPPLPDSDLVRIARSIAERDYDPSFVDAEKKRIAKVEGAADRVLSVEQVMNLPPPEYVIDGIWPSGGVNVLFGPPGSLKSFLAMEWSVSRALGADWHSHAVREPSKVLYVAAEGIYGMGVRLGAYMDRHGIEAGALGNLSYHSGAINLLHEEGQEIVLRLIEDYGVKLLVFDTLRKSMTGGDENNAQEVGTLMSFLEDLSVEFSCDSLLIHHANKAKDGKPAYRGSSAIEGDAYNIWSLTKDSKDRKHVILEPLKLKDAPDDWKLGVRFVEHKNSLVSDVTLFGQSEFIEDDKKKDEVLKYLAEGLTQKEIALKVGLSQGRISQIKKEAKK